MTEETATLRMRWAFAKFCFDHVGDESFPDMCKALGINLREAKRLALEFAHG